VARAVRVTGEAGAPPDASAGTRCTLDASALLAYLGREPGYEPVRQALRDGARISTVNLSEAYAKLVQRAIPLDPVINRVHALGLRAVPFDEHLARCAAELLPHTRRLGLSLGDRAALALAQALAVPVLTTDRAWAKLDVNGISVRLIR